MPVALRNFLITFLLSLLVFGAIAFLLVNFVLDIFGDNPGGQNIGDTTTETGGEVTGPVGESDGSSFNVLLIGTDYQPDILFDYNPAVAAMYPKFKRLPLDPESEQGLSSAAYRRISPDTILIMRVSKEHGLFMFTSLPTNMLVYSGGAATTLGDLYQDEGFELFCSKVYGLTGLSIDYYVIADIKGLAKAIDLVDGITYTVPVAMSYSDPAQNLHISLKAGAKKLYGDQALQLLRYNNYTTGTHSRLKTGVAFFRAVVFKMTNALYRTHILKMYEQISPYFTTDFTLADLTKNLDLIFKYPEFTKIEVAYPGSNTEIQGVTYFEPNIKQAIANYSAYR